MQFAYSIVLGRRLAVTLALLFAAPGSAQQVPAMSECPRIALAKQATPARAIERPSEPLVIRDGACWIEWSDAIAANRRDAYWIDVRSAAEALQSRLAGTLQVPLSDISTKAFLKTSSLILIGSGRDDGELERACGDLRRQGFRDAKLLHGGVRAWYESGRPLLADGRMVDALFSITSLDFHRQLGAARWTLLQVGSEVSIDLSAGARSVPIVTASNVDGAIARIRRLQADAAQQSREERPTAIVVITRNEATSIEMRNVVRHEGLHNVLALVGGAEGYQQFLAQQKQIAANAGAPLVRPCGSG